MSLSNKEEESRRRYEFFFPSKKAKKDDKEEPKIVKTQAESVDKLVQPYVSEDSAQVSSSMMKPRQLETSAEDKTEENDIKIVCEKVRAILDKVSLVPQHLLIQEFIALDVSSNQNQLSQTVEIILEKAFEKPMLCAHFMEICKSQVNPELVKNGGTSEFRNTLLTRTQYLFQEEKHIEGVVLNEIKKENDPEKRRTLLAEEKKKFIRRRAGLITFIGHLYLNSLLSEELIKQCCDDLFHSTLPITVNGQQFPANIDEESIHYGLRLLKIVGNKFDKSEKESKVFLDKWIEKLDDVKSLCSEQTRDMIFQLVELRRNKWVPIELSGLQKECQETGREQIEDPKGSQTSIGEFKGPEQAFSDHKLETSDCAPKPILPADDSPLLKSESECVPMEVSSVQKKDDGSPCQETGGEKVTVSNGSKAKDSNDPKEPTSNHKLEILDSAFKPIVPTVFAPTRQLQKSWLSKDESAARESIMTSVKSGIQDVIKGNLSLTDMTKNIKDYVGNEKYAKPSLTVVYSMIIRTISEKEMNKEERENLAEVLRMSLASKTEKQAFIDGAVLMCKCAMNTPNLWIHTAEVLFDMIKIGDEPTISLNELGPVFMANKNRFELFVQFMKLWVEEEIQDKSAIESLPWLFMERSFAEEMIRNDLREEMKLVKMSNGASLADLLIR